MAQGIFNLKQVVQAIQQGGWSAQKTPAVEYLVVAGGGGGSYLGGGGGAGGLLQGLDPVPNGQTLLVTVGGGGAGGSGGGAGVIGVNSVFGQISATGGGRGGAYASTVGGNGGSGGGGNNFETGNANGPGQGTFGQGNAGGRGTVPNGSNYQGGGGGGAGTVGAVGNYGNGGFGVASAITGTTTTYAGGGGGSADTGGVAGLGGAGGGGAGGASRGASGGTGTINGANGTANTGGGGGAYGVSGTGGTGGSGIVIVSYPDVYAAATSTTGSPTVSTSGSGSVYSSGGANHGSIGTNTDWTFLHDGTTDWTFEFFAYFSSVASGQYYSGTSNVSTQPGCYFLIGSNNTLMFGVGGSQYAFITSNNGAIPSTNTWYQIAFTYTASTKTINIYVNGASVGSGSFGGTMDTRAATYALGLCHGGTTDYWNGGNITNLRISKVKRTTVTSVQSTPFVRDASTYYLLSAVSGAYLADSSGTGLTIATTGSFTWNQLSPFTVTGYKNRVYTWTSSGSITF